MGLVWKSIEQLSLLLEPAERQAALGDIEERGVSPRAALDLASLVALRQLQFWRRRETWFHALALLFPTIAAITCAGGAADSFERFNPRLLTGAATASCILAWSAGFVAGRDRGLSLLLVTATVGGVFSRTLAGSSLLAITGLAAIPVLAGFIRGLRGTPLRRSTAVLLATLGIPGAAIIVPLATNDFEWRGTLLMLAIFLWPWPYAAASAWTHHER